MSKKTRPRRSAAASQARSGQPGASRASQPVTGQGPGQAEADAIVQRVLGDLWQAVASGELLRAEIESSTCMEIPRVLGVRDTAEEEQFRATVLVRGRGAAATRTARRCCGCSWRWGRRPPSGRPAGRWPS